MSCVCWVCNYCNGYRWIQLSACYTPRPRVPPWITLCPPLLWRNSSSADLPDIVWAGFPLWYSSSDRHPHFLHVPRRCVLWIPLLSYKWHRVWVRYTFGPTLYKCYRNVLYFLGISCACHYPSKQESSTRCSFNVGPASQTLDQR